MASRITEQHRTLIPRIISMSIAGKAKFLIANDLNISAGQLNALYRSSTGETRPFTVGEHIERIARGYK